MSNELKQEQAAFSFLQNGGEMGEMIRHFDWETTPLHGPASWPQSLRTTLSILLHSKFPMFLFWGKDLTCFYNDAFRPSLGNEGKHPWALGKPGAMVWEEIWNTIGPWINQVLSGGEAIWMEDQLVPFYRNGKMETIYWTFSYSPVFDESEKPAGVFVACTETTQKIAHLERLQTFSRQFRDLVIQAPVAIAVLKGPDFVVEIANERMLEIWGKKAEEMNDRPLFEGLPEARDQGFAELLHQVMETGETFTAYARPASLPRGGRMETLYLNFVYEAIHEPDGAISGIMVVAVDVTEQELAKNRIEEVVSQRTRELAEVNETLLKTNRELERSNANLEEFAHVASHDLKEPIRKIHFFTDRLKTQLADRLLEEEKCTFDRIEKASKRMNILIDDLLSYSHVSHRPLEMEEIDLNEKLKKVLEDLELEIEQKNALVQVGPLPVVKGYRRQLQQLFQNLLSNALKYSKQGERPRIEVSLYQPGPGDDELIRAMQKGHQYHIIEVRDYGIGFHQQEAEKIFQMFQRLHGNNEYSGTGVGLAIVRKVVANHHGFLFARGEPGKGARFFIGLPA